LIDVSILAHLLDQVGGPSLLERQIVDLSEAACADLKCQRGVVQRRFQWARDGWTIAIPGVEDGLGDFSPTGSCRWDSADS